MLPVAAAEDAIPQGAAGGELDEVATANTRRGRVLGYSLRLVHVAVVEAVMFSLAIVLVLSLFGVTAIIGTLLFDRASQEDFQSGRELLASAVEVEKRQTS